MVYPICKNCKNCKTVRLCLPGLQPPTSFSQAYPIMLATMRSSSDCCEAELLSRSYHQRWEMKSHP